jgi:hypothetical protein
MPEPETTEAQAEDRTRGVLRLIRPASPTRLERRIGISSILQARDARATPIRIGRLEVEQKLGEGAMGIVYRARDPELDRTVAVKVLRAEAGDRQRRRIITEARALARLSHPGVVAVYDIASSDDDLYITMEYVDGGTLRGWLEAHGDAGPVEIVRLFVQAARGLDAAHRAGVVHQDFKPDNVLVGRDGRVRVADFGLAHLEVVGDDGDPASVRFVGGTPRYMAPELLRGQLATPESDQFSFCVALGEALAGQPSTSSGGLPSRVGAILGRGLEETPTERWPDMGALADALDRLLRPRPDERHRDLLLDRVETLWLRGVLCESLAGTEPAPLSLRLRTDQVQRPWADPAEGAASPPEETTILDLRTLMRRGRDSLLVLGRPGAGKTTAMLVLARELLTAARLDPLEPAPAVLGLASFDPRISSLTEWAVGELVTKYSLPSRWAREWLEGDALVLLLDGLDEVPTSRRRAALQAIDAFRREHPVPIVVTCREDEYDAVGVKLRFGVAVEVQPLRDDQVRAFLDRAGAHAVRAAFDEDPSLRDALKNPLMLSVLAVSGGAPRSHRPEALWSEIYGRYVEHALQSKVASSPYAPERMRAGLHWLARAMHREGVTDLWLERLQASYFVGAWEQRTTRILGAIAMAVLIFGGNALPQLLLGFAYPPVFILSGISVALVFVLVRSLRVRPVEALGWSWSRALGLLPTTWGFGLVAAGAMSLRFFVFGVDPDMGTSDAGDYFIATLCIGLLMGTAGAGMLGTVPGDREARTRPNEGITQSLRNGLLVGVPSAIGVALVLAYVAVPHLVGRIVELGGYWREPSALSVRYGAFFSVGLFFVYGGAAVVLHAVVRLMLALRTPLPLRLVRFLDHAADSGLLRRVGGGYIFMHRTLLDYFAALSPEEKTGDVHAEGHSSDAGRAARE